MREPASSEATREAAFGALARWCEGRPIELCVVFGSRARGDHAAASDLDVALWPNGRTLPPASERISWQNEISRAVGHEAQVVFVTARLDPVLGMQIAREGKLVHESRAGLWESERRRLWQLYQDSAPFLAAARRSLQEFAERTRRGT